MARKPPSTRIPAKYPSIPDSESGPTKYNEPDIPVREDRVPDVSLGPAVPYSRADLRLRIEQLLLRKDQIPTDAWAELGDEARTVLIEMLDDEAVRSWDALYHRLIGALGQLSVKRSVAPLSAILADGSETQLTRAYAANALGRIGEPTAIEALARATNHKDDMVRRQVAMALGRLERDTAIPHLMKLQRDKSPAVSEVAIEAVRRWEAKLGQRLGPKPKAAAVKKAKKKKTMPAPERR